MNGGQDQSKRKDGWDKLDIFGKSLSTVVLAIIAVAIKYGADSIVSSLQKGDFVRNLIADLAMPAEKTRRDIALIALNYTLSQPRDNSLVAAIAERILTTVSESDELTGEVAFQILQQRDQAAVIRVRKRAADLVASARNSQENQSNLTDPQQDRTSAIQTPQLPAFVRSVFPNVVYIQYRNQAMEPIALELRQTFEKNKLNAPGVGLIDAEYTNGIRYFHVEDQIAASQVADIANKFFKDKKLDVQFKLEFVQSSKFKGPKGQVEIWMNIAL